MKKLNHYKREGWWWARDAVLGKTWDHVCKEMNIPVWGDPRIIDTTMNRECPICNPNDAFNCNFCKYRHRTTIDEIRKN